MNSENYEVVEEILKDIEEMDMKFKGLENETLEKKINLFEKKLHDIYGYKLEEIKEKKEKGESYDKEEEVRLSLIIINLRVEFGNKYISLNDEKEKQYNL